VRIPHVIGATRSGTDRLFVAPGSTCSRTCTRHRAHTRPNSDLTRTCGALSLSTELSRPPSASCCWPGFQSRRCGAPLRRSHGCSLTVARCSLSRKGISAANESGSRTMVAPPCNRRMAVGFQQHSFLAVSCCRKLPGFASRQKMDSNLPN